MFTHSTTIEAGTRVRSLLNGAEYVVSRNYDPTNIRRQATISLMANGTEFAIAADRFEQDFEVVATR